MYALSQITRWPDGAAAVVEAGGLQLLEEAFGSEHSGIRGWMCVMLGNLAVHECTALALANFSPCRKLVALSQSVSVIVVAQAVIINLNPGIQKPVSSKMRCADWRTSRRDPTVPLPFSKREQLTSSMNSLTL
jgi:hypothetical protein